MDENFLDNNQIDEINQILEREIKIEKTFQLSETTYKILCQADPKNFNPSTGIENLCMMFLSLNGPINFTELEIKRAKQKAKELNLIKDSPENLT